MRFESLLASPEIQALGWSLVHFLWQGALFAALLWVVNASLAKSFSRQSAAKLRYGTACIVLLLMPATLIATLVQMYPPRMHVLAQPVTTAPSGVTSPVPNIASTVTTPTVAGPGLPGWIVCFWLVGILVLSARAAIGWIGAQRIKRQTAGSVESQWIEELAVLKRRLGVIRPVRLCVSAVTKVPMVIGWIRPFILLPATAITGLGETQLRAVLAHELAHVRRYDYLINLLQTAIETLLFYHPAVWWVSRQIRAEREHCCDDIAIAVCGDAAEYVRALTQLEELSSPRLQPVVAANGGELLGRVRRLLNSDRSEHRFPRSLAAMVAALLIVGVIATPSFHVPGTVSPLQVVAMGAEQSKTPSPEPPPTISNPKTSGAQVERQIREQDLLIGGAEREYQRIADEYRRTVAEMQRSFSRNLLDDRPGSEQGPSAESSQLLIKLYDGTQEVELKRHILEYLGASSSQAASDKLLSVVRSDNNPELREHAINLLGGKASAFDTLVSLYDNTRGIETKSRILDSLAASDSQQASDKLLSIARSDPAPELRKHAIDYLATKPNAFDALVSLYDGTREIEVKRHILDYLGSSNDPRVTDKLFSIAQSDPDIELRRAAVDYIAVR